MTAGPDLDEISRRLVELAESAGPWDDPLPEVHRRAAGLTTDSESTESPVFRSPAAVRRSLRWVNPSLVASAAAVVTAVGTGSITGTSKPEASRWQESARQSRGACRSRFPVRQSPQRRVPGPCRRPQ